MCKVPNLFSLLYEYHISQKQFADLFNVSAGNVSDWKNGRSAPNIEKLVEIADYYKVTVDYLLGRQVSTPELSENESILLSFFRECSDNSQKILLDLAEHYSKQDETAKEKEKISV